MPTPCIQWHRNARIFAGVEEVLPVVGTPTATILAQPVSAALNAIHTALTTGTPFCVSDTALPDMDHIPPAHFATLTGGTIENGTLTATTFAFEAGTVSAVLAGGSATKTTAGTLVLSIMAGKTMGDIAARLPATSIARAMPNTPAAIRQGFTAAFAGPGVSAAQKALADALLAAIGEVAWVDQEDQINPVTAVSGGGPAYVFLLAEVLEAAAVEQGLPRDLARRMARATVAGSGALLGASEQDAADLRRAVTSPKGTTERALAVLMEADAWPKAMSRAIQAATDRARELAG